MPAKPPLALSAVSIDAAGKETTWWSGDKYAANRPQSLSFRTRIGEGFSDAGVTLARRIDQDYNDLVLFNDVVAVGDDGQIAYEGRIGSTPRSTQGGHSIAVQCAGHMAHAKDRKFRDVYVDRTLGNWEGPSVQLQADVISAMQIGSHSVGTDDTGSDQALVLSLPAGDWNARRPVGFAVYDAGPEVEIGAIYYSFSGNWSSGDAAWNLVLYVGPDDRFNAGTVNSGELAGSNPSTGYYTPATTNRYALIQFDYNTTSASSQPQYQLYGRKLAVYGTHGLTRRGDDPGGFYASDVIRDIASRFCPKLSTAGVEDTTLVIPHVAFRERTTPFDAFLLLNGPHGYELAVWENKTLHFRPYDLSDYDWQVRMDQPGVDLSNQGDTTEGLANYVVVEFDNVLTGRRDQVSPSDDSGLEDTTVDHPANLHGLDVELTVGLTFPTTPDVAIAFGRSYLAEFNRPKNRGQITVQGHILDRAGHWSQPWMVRAGQTISVVDHPNDSPRLITETSYDHSSRTVTISTDNGELNQLEAVVDYIRTSLSAANL